MRTLPLLCLTATTLLLTACGGDSRTAPPATFTAFVKSQLATTSDQRDPVAVNSVDFKFRDLDNPDAYNSVVGNGR